MKNLLFAMVLGLLFILVSAPARAQINPDFLVSKVFNFPPGYIADKLAYPVNHGRMEGYEDANPFQRLSNYFHSRHLGADISGIEGGNSDLGDKVYAIGSGKVIYALAVKGDDKSYSSIIMILHKTTKGYIVSLYRHCQKPLVKYGDLVEYLQPISTIGNDFGLYEAHLHLEIRTNVFKDIELGYGDPAGYVDPMKFIREYNEGNRNKSPVPDKFIKQGKQDN